MTCIFCRIIAKEEPSTIIYEDKDFIAFLDTRPVFLGHTLLLPKKHIETFYDLTDDRIGPLFIRAKKIGHAIQQGLKAEGSFIALNNRISQSVLHTHVHLIPRNRGDGLKGFFWPRQKYQSEEEKIEIQQKIMAHLK